MNRQQRRAAARHQHAGAATHRRADPLAAMRLLDRARPFDPGDTTEQHIKTRACFERLADGTADGDDFDRVAMAINLAKVRALEIDRGLADMLETAQDAMTHLRVRQERWGKWDMLATERAAVAQALDAAEAIADASSPLQMRRALDVVRRVVLRNARPAGVQA